MMVLKSLTEWMLSHGGVVGVQVTPPPREGQPEYVVYHVVWYDRDFIVETVDGEIVDIQEVKEDVKSL